jgi:hypothetical protein
LHSPYVPRPLSTALDLLDSLLVSFPARDFRSRTYPRSSAINIDRSLGRTENVRQPDDGATSDVLEQTVPRLTELALIKPTSTLVHTVNMGLTTPPRDSSSPRVRTALKLDVTMKLRGLPTSSFVRFTVFCALSATLTMCGSAKKKPSNALTPEGGAAGEHGGTAGQGSGGASAGETGESGQGGEPSAGNGGEMNGGAAGEPASSGTGGTAGEGGTGNGGSAGTAGESGEAGNAGEGPTCEPAPTCGQDQPTCESGWDANCASGFTECCDPDVGVYKTCDTDNGRTETFESVFINSCTDTSFGTEPCGGCLSAGDPDCDGNWQLNGCVVKTFCSDFMLGYRMSCEEVDQYTFRTHVECLCNP